MSAGSHTGPRWRTLGTHAKNPRERGRFSGAIPRCGRRPRRPRAPQPSRVCTGTAPTPSPASARAHAPRPWWTLFWSSPPAHQRASSRCAAGSPRVPGALGALLTGPLVVGCTGASRWRPTGPPRWSRPPTGGRAGSQGPRPPGPWRRRRRPWRPWCCPPSGWPGWPASTDAAAPATSSPSGPGGVFFPSRPGAGGASAAPHGQAASLPVPAGPARPAGPCPPATLPRLAAAEAVPPRGGQSAHPSVGPRRAPRSADGRVPGQHSRAGGRVCTDTRGRRGRLASVRRGPSESPEPQRAEAGDGPAPWDSWEGWGHGRASVYDILTCHDPGIQ
jgi:hypothetical protein